jgi:hypothetical protein
VTELIRGDDPRLLVPRGDPLHDGPMPPGTGTGIAQHQSISNERYTPRKIVEAERELMGGIDFDPFSCSRANELIQARAFCSLENGLNGFKCAWSLEGKPTNTHCNPPGGKLDRKTLEPVGKGPGLSSAAVAWAKLMHEWQTGNVAQAVFIGFNLEILRTSQEWIEKGIPGCSSFPLCFPDERLRFWNDDTAEDEGSPTCANVIVYVPAQFEGSSPANGERFERLFSAFGQVKL